MAQSKNNPAQLVIDGKSRSYLADVCERRDNGLALIARFDSKIPENLTGRKLESGGREYIVISQSDETTMSVGGGKSHSTLLVVADSSAAAVEIDFHEQRKKHGFDDGDVFSLNRTVLSFLVPRLQAFAAQKFGGSRETFGAMQKIAGEIADGFCIKLQSLEQKQKLGAKDARKVERAFSLFAEHFDALVA